MGYSFDIQEDSITFKTGDFITDKGSVLHSGIYNRELTSSMAAGATLVLMGLLSVPFIEINALFWVVLLLAFIGLFVAYRYLVFRDPILVLSIDLKKGHVTLTERRHLFTKSQRFNRDEIKGIKRDYTCLMPENPDGVKVVEGIALQHFTVIPGFGQPSEFHRALLQTEEGKEIVLFASKDRSQTEEVINKLDAVIKGLSQSL